MSAETSKYMTRAELHEQLDKRIEGFSKTVERIANTAIDNDDAEAIIMFWQEKKRFYQSLKYYLPK